MIRRFFYWLFKIFRHGSKKNIPKDDLDCKFTTIYLSEIPDKIEPNKLYVIGEPNFLWTAIFLCPCHCNQIIYLNLLSGNFPFWEIEIELDNIPTISPSIRRIKGCESHFFIRRGNIQWCRDDPHYIDSINV